MGRLSWPLLADVVVAVGVDSAALAQARQRTAGAAVKLVRAVLEAGEGCAALADGFADAVVSFETLERLVRGGVGAAKRS